MQFMASKVLRPTVSPVMYEGAVRDASYIFFVFALLHRLQYWIKTASWVIYCL